MMSVTRKFISLFIVVLLSFNGNAQESLTPVGKKYPVVAWYSVDAPHNTREHYKLMSKAGFNLSLSAPLTKDETIKGLREARGTGVKLIIDCQDSRNANIAFITEVKNYSSLGMYYLSDEPGKDYFDNLVSKVDRINSTDGIHSGYINLLPIYASNDQLKAKSYDDYLDSYLSKVHTSILSYDHYPFVREIFRNDFYANLEVVSRKSRDVGKPFWGFVRSCYTKDYCNIDEGRLRLQVFANMAYGAQGIQYFTYGVPKGGRTAVLDSLYQKTKLYDLVTIINREVQAVGKYTLGADFITVIHVSEESENIMIPNIKSIEHSGESLLVSLFKKDGVMYLMMVNKDYLSIQNVSVEFNSKARIINKKGCKKTDLKRYVGAMPAGDWLLFQLN